MDRMPLGVVDVVGIGLSNLPEAPERFRHRMTYINVPIEAGARNIVQGQSQFTSRNCQVKTLRANTTIGSGLTVFLRPTNRLDSMLSPSLLIFEDAVRLGASLLSTGRGIANILWPGHNSKSMLD